MKLDLITFNGVSTQFTEIQVGGAMLQTSWQCTRSLHALTVRRNVVECWLKNVLRWFLPTDLQTGTLVTFTLYIVTSEITESCTNDLGIYIGLQNLCFLKRWTISLIGMWMLVLDSGGNDLSVFLRSNDADLDFFFFFFSIKMNYTFC